MMRQVGRGATATLLLLCACSNDPSSAALSLSSVLESLRTTGETTAPALPATLSRAAIDQLPLPNVVLVRRDASGETTFMTPIGGNNGSVVMMSQERDSVTLRRGRVVATNGFGYDLFGQEINGTTRTYLTLDPVNALRRTRFDCSITAQTAEQLLHYENVYTVQKTTETCRADTFSFTNSFWIDRASGVAWRSRQWISPEFGYLTIETLKQEG